MQAGREHCDRWRRDVLDRCQAVSQHVGHWFGRTHKRPGGPDVYDSEMQAPWSQQHAVHELDYSVLSGWDVGQRPSVQCFPDTNMENFINSQILCSKTHCPKHGPYASLDGLVEPSLKHLKR